MILFALYYVAKLIFQSQDMYVQRQMLKITSIFQEPVVVASREPRRTARSSSAIGRPMQPSRPQPSATVLPWMRAQSPSTRVTADLSCWDRRAGCAVTMALGRRKASHFAVSYLILFIYSIDESQYSYQK